MPGRCSPTSTFEISDQFELDVALRYDEDKRENTTKTPPAFLPDPSAVHGRGAHRNFERDPAQGHAALQADRRHHVVRRLEPRASAAAASTRPASARWPMPAASRASTTSSRPRWPTPGRSGFKGQFLDRRLNVGLSIFDTESTNGYFFVFLAANSTQNLGNLDADYKGAEFEISAKVTDNFELFGSYGYTDSEITGMEDPSVIGNQAPLVSQNTYNLGAQWRQPFSDKLDVHPACRLPAHRARPGGSRTIRLRAIRSISSTCASDWKARSGPSRPGRRISPTRNTTPSSRRADSCSARCRVRYGVEFSYDF